MQPASSGNPPALRPPEHQVAGHRANQAENVLQGPLIDGQGRFYKPFQSTGRGAAELSFYTSFSSIPDTIRRRYFPSFHGTILVGEPPIPHLILEDLLAGMSEPSVLDAKIGAMTWPPDSPEDHFAKCVKRDRESTSAALGFRLSGMQIADGNGGFRRLSKGDAKKIVAAADVRRTFQEFFRDAPSAAGALGGENGVIAQLRELKGWFEEQTLFHFYSASVLIAYECSGKGQLEDVRVKLVDFAHVLDGDGVIDHNFLGGLSSLIKIIGDVADVLEKSGSQE